MSEKKPKKTRSSPAPAPETKTNWGEELYTGAATIGKVSSYIYLFFGTIFALILIAMGIYTLKNGGVTTTHPDGRTTTTFGDSPDTLQPNQQPASKSTGWIFIGVGLLILLFSWGYWYFVRKYKAVAAVSGVSFVADTFTPNFRLDTFGYY